MRQPPQHISAPLKHLFQALASAICFAPISITRWFLPSSAALLPFT